MSVVMDPPSPLYVLINASAAITDICFWDITFNSDKSESPQEIDSFKDNKLLLAGYSNSGGVDLWNLKSRRVIRKYASDIGVLSVHGTHRGEVIYLNRNGDLRIFDAGCSSPKIRLQIPNVAYCKMSCIDDDNQLYCAVSGDKESSICVWDLRNEKIISILNTLEDKKMGMAMSIKLFENHDDMFCLGGYESGWLYLWAVQGQNVLHWLQIFDTDPIMCLDFVSSQMSGVLGSPSEYLKKFSIDKDENSCYHITIRKTRTMMNPGVADVKIRPDCKIVVAGGWHDGTVRVFGFKTLKPLAVLDYHSGTVQCIAFRKNAESSEQILASGSVTNKIALWHIYNN